VCIGIWINSPRFGTDLPVNIKIMYDGMEEYGRDGIFESINGEAA